MKVFGLFSGIGGFELGFQRAGMEIGAYCEIEEHCLKVMRKNFPDAKEFNDVSSIELKEGEWDVMCGGFPCQDISIAGKNRGLLGGDKSSLWLHFRRLIEDARPKYAVIENVNALLGRGLEVILQHLAEIGYDAAWTTYDSKYFGVPQRRRRVYIVAFRDGIPEGSNIFDFKERYSRREEHRSKVDAVEQGFDWSFTEIEEGRSPFAYFTRQGSREYSTRGVASTLLKRDYKDFTDLILVNGVIRTLSPEERLLLQGYPIDWWDGCELTKTQKYMCNGMTVNVVEHIGKNIMELKNV